MSLSFQEIIFTLQHFWASQGCAILQPYDLEMGAGTFHPATVLRTLKEPVWNVAYVQPSRRPKDSRFGTHPNRAGRYYQFQVILKPTPSNIQQLYLQSLAKLGIDVRKEDIRFVEDDWESPTLGAAGLGWEVWCNGMEVTQFTYMQQIGGVPCKPAAGEITYGLERLAMYIQNVDEFSQIKWNSAKEAFSYHDIELEAEEQNSHYYLEHADTKLLMQHFLDMEAECERMLSLSLPAVAYDFCIKASHIFNIIESRGAVSTTQRAEYIARVRKLAKSCCTQYLKGKING